MNNRQLGLLIIFLGALLIIAGALIWAGAFSWFGRLPGDVHIESGDVSIFIPITSMLLISIVLSLLLSVINKLF